LSCLQWKSELGPTPWSQTAGAALNFHGTQPKGLQTFGAQDFTPK